MQKPATTIVTKTTSLRTEDPDLSFFSLCICLSCPVSKCKGTKSTRRYLLTSDRCSFSSLKKPQTVRRKSSRITCSEYRYAGSANAAPEEGGNRLSTHKDLRTKSMATSQVKEKIEDAKKRNTQKIW